MTDFDWAWPKRIDRAAVEAVLRLDFLADARNVVLVAAQGLGKTMIAQNIAHAAVLAGTHVLFTTAAQLLLDLGSQESTRALARRLNHYATRALLVIDEIGYLSYDARAADLLFQVVTRRYEKRSLVLTTNLPFSDWPTIFPNAGSAIALIDRLVHHAEIITIDGDSYRRRVAEATRKPPRPAVRELSGSRSEFPRFLMSRNTFEKGQRKDDVMAAHLMRFTAAEGIVFVGRAQEKTPVFRTEKRRNPTTGQTYPWIVRSTAMVNHFYFYCRRPRTSARSS